MIGKGIFKVKNKTLIHVLNNSDIILYAESIARQCVHYGSGLLSLLFTLSTTSFKQRFSDVFRSYGKRTLA